MISWKEVVSPKTILHGRDAILRVRDKWLIFNMVSQLWADVKYHVPTGIDFSPKASDFYFSASQYLSTKPRREFPMVICLIW